MYNYLVVCVCLVIIGGCHLARALEYFSTSGNQIVNRYGNPVRITGINWFGFETEEMIPHGLDVRNYKELLDQVKSLGFNALRIPYSTEMLNSAEDSLDISSSLNPDLSGLTPLEVMDKVVEYCTLIDLRIVLDRHSCRKGAYEEEDLWYVSGDSTCTEQVWIDGWTMLAARYKNVDTIIGADLFNEPKRSVPTWGTLNPATDWNKAAERCGNAILSVEPNWLIFVEGIANYEGDYTWWGANLIGAQNDPVQLNVPNKLVYSIHEYPLSVGGQTWFSDPTYPQNLDEVWYKYWGYLVENNNAPILVGELGTKLITSSDQTWLASFMSYLDGDWDLDGKNKLNSFNQKGISFMYWSLNPNSADTGGILSDDWTTVRQDKMAYISASLDPDSITLNQQTGPPIFAPTIAPTQSPTNTPTTFVASFQLRNLTEIYNFESSTATALSETVAIVLNLTFTDVTPVDVYNTPATLQYDVVYSTLRRRLQSSAVAYTSCIVSALQWPGYAKDSTALYIALYETLDKSIADQSFNTIFQNRLSMPDRFPKPLVDLLQPGALSTSVGSPSEPLFFPTPQPTSDGNEVDSANNKADGTRDLAVVSVVVLLSGLLICCAFAIFFRKEWRSEDFVDVESSSSVGLGVPNTTKVKNTAGNRQSVRAHSKGENVDANEVYQDSIRKHEENERQQSEAQFEQYQMVLSNAKAKAASPPISPSIFRSSSSSYSSRDTEDETLEPKSSFISNSYNYISRSLSRSKDANNQNLLPVASSSMSSASQSSIASSHLSPSISPCPSPPEEETEEESRLEEIQKGHSASSDSSVPSNSGNISPASPETTPIDTLTSMTDDSSSAGDAGIEGIEGTGEILMEAKSNDSAL